MAELYARHELAARRREWKAEGKTVVFTNGCYDILHPGHIRLLERARSLGDVLILALNTDASVQRLKGPSRPFFNESARAELALQLEAIDAVTFFDEDTPRELIAEILPDILVKGADWTHFIAGREEVEAAGGRVLTLPLEPGYSTTDIAAKIIARAQSQAASHGSEKKSVLERKDLSDLIDVETEPGAPATRSTDSSSAPHARAKAQ